MASTIKVDNIQDSSGNNIINESSNTITIGASGDTTNIVGTLQNNGASVASVAGTESFLAILSSNQTVSDNTITLAQFDTEAYDVGSNYTNSLTFKYTAPSAGKYRFYSNIAGATDGSWAIDNVSIRLYKNLSLIHI